MNITLAQYKQNLEGKNASIFIVVDGEEWYVPLAPGNRFYDEIMRQVDAGDLTIKEAD